MEPQPLGARHIALVDNERGPSHLIGVALDGFPIYGDKDMNGHARTASSLDACNGTTSPTSEFPQGMYHYVLPSGVKEHNASMRCYSGAVSRAELAKADAIGFCYAPRGGIQLGNGYGRKPEEVSASAQAMQSRNTINHASRRSTVKCD